MKDRLPLVFVDLARFRNDYIANIEAVAQTIARPTKRFKVFITQRPAKSTASIIAKLEREHCRLSLNAEIDYADNRNVEIVILRSDSLAELKRTHARYFKSVTELQRF